MDRRIVPGPIPAASSSSSSSPPSSSASAHRAALPRPPSATSNTRLGAALPRAVAATAPLDRILVETDAPYLAPVPNRGKRNEPAFTALTAACVAGLRDMDQDAFGQATPDNFFGLFRKAQLYKAEARDRTRT